MLLAHDWRTLPHRACSYSNLLLATPEHANATHLALVRAFQQCRDAVLHQLITFGFRFHDFGRRSQTCFKILFASKKRGSSCDRHPCIWTKRTTAKWTWNAWKNHTAPCSRKHPSCEAAGPKPCWLLIVWLKLGTSALLEPRADRGKKGASNCSDPQAKTQKT